MKQTDSNRVEFHTADKVKRIVSKALEIAPNDFAHAAALMKEAMKIARENELTDLLIGVKINLGRLYLETGNETKFLYYLRKAIVRANSNKDYDNLEMAYSGLGVFYWNKSNYKRALYYFTQANLLVKHIKNKVVLYKIFKNLAITHHKLQAIFLAKEYFQKAYKVAKKYNQQANIADSLYWQGLFHYQEAKFDVALKLYLESLALHNEVKNYFGSAITLNSIGLLYRDWREYDKALSYFKKCKIAAKKSTLHSDNLMADTFNNIGLVHADFEEWEEALNNYLLSLEYRRKSGFKDHEGTTLLNIAGIYQKKNDYVKALEFAKEALKIKKQIGDPALICSTLSLIVMICVTDNKKSEAQKFVHELLEYAVADFDMISKIQVFSALTDYYSVLGDYQKALESNKKMYELKLLVYDETVRKKMYDVEYRLKYEKAKLKTKNRIQNERVKTVLALACTTSHEVNQPLMVIQGNIELLEMSFQGIFDSGKGETYIKNILNAVDRIKQILSELSHLERISFKRYTPSVEMIEMPEREKE